MASEAVLSILLKAKSGDAERVLNGFMGKLQSHSKTFKIAGAAMLGAGVGIAAGSLKAAADVGKAYSIIQAGTGATGDAMKSMKAIFDKVAVSTSADMETVAGVIAEVNTRLGLTGKPLEQMATGFSEVSRMAGIDATQATIAVTKAMNLWQVPAEQAPKFLDKLFVASQQTGMGIDKLGQFMSEYGSVLKGAGYSTEESIALFGAFHKAGLPVTRIMPGINMAMRKFASEGINVSEGLKDTIKRMKEAKTSTKALNIATETFGAEGAVRLTDAVRSGILELDELTAIIQGSEGAVFSFSEATKDPAARLGELKNRIMLTSAKIGQAFLPALEKIVTLVTPILDRLGKWMEKHPKLTAIVVAATAAIGALLLVLGFLPSIMGGISAAAGVMGGAMTFAMGPIGLIAIAITGLIAIGIALWKNWDKVAGFAKTAWNKIKTTVVDVANKIWDFLKKWGLLIVGILFPIAGIVLAIVKWRDQILNILKLAWEAIKNFMKDWGLFILGLIFPPALIAGVILKWGDTIKEKIGDLVSKIWDAIKSVAEVINKPFKMAAEWIAGNVDNIAGFFVSLPSKIWDAIKDIGSIIAKPFLQAFNLIKDTFTALLGFLLPGSEAAAEDIKSKITSKVTGGQGQVYSMQHGGVVPGPIGTPVPIVAHAGETVIPVGKRLGSNISLTLNVGTMLGDRQDAEALVDMIADELRARQRRALGEAIY